MDAEPARVAATGPVGEPPRPPNGGAPPDEVDSLVLTATPAADAAVTTSGYGPLPGAPDRRTRALERLAIYLLRVLTGILVGGAAMLATVRWTRLDAGLVKDVFLATFAAVTSIAGAVTGFYYGSVDRGGTPPRADR